MKRRVITALIAAGMAWMVAGCRPPAGSSTQNLPAANPQAAQPSDQGSQNEVRESESPGRQRRGGRSRADATPGAFDFYLLTLSWSPEFCVAHAQAAECAAHPGFVLHGLWPQNLNGSYPEHCSSAPGPANPGAYSDILPDAGLLEHEWQTHGTCSGLGPDAYFNAARQAIHAVTIPPAITSIRSPIQLTPQQILTDFAQANPGNPPDSFALSCGNNRLTAVEVCLAKDLHAVSCSGVRSCRANSVKITPPGGD